MHGDDADSHRRRTFGVTTMSGATTTGGTWDTRLVLDCHDNNQCAPSTAAEIDCWHVWGMICGMSGIHLDVDFWGRKFDETYYPERKKKAGQKLGFVFKSSPSSLAP